MASNNDQAAAAANNSPEEDNFLYNVWVRQFSAELDADLAQVDRQIAADIAELGDNPTQRQKELIQCMRDSRQVRESAGRAVIERRAQLEVAKLDSRSVNAQKRALEEELKTLP